MSDPASFLLTKSTDFSSFFFLTNIILWVIDELLSSCLPHLFCKYPCLYSSFVGYRDRDIYRIYEDQYKKKASLSKKSYSKKGHVFLNVPIFLFSKCTFFMEKHKLLLHSLVVIAKQRKSTRCVCCLRKRRLCLKSQNDWVFGFSGWWGAGVGWGSSPSWSFLPCGPLRMSNFSIFGFSLRGCVPRRQQTDRLYEGLIVPRQLLRWTSVRPCPFVWGIICCSCERKKNA